VLVGAETVQVRHRAAAQAEGPGVSAEESATNRSGVAAYPGAEEALPLEAEPAHPVLLAVAQHPDPEGAERFRQVAARFPGEEAVLFPDPEAASGSFPNPEDPVALGSRNQEDPEGQVEDRRVEPHRLLREKPAQAEEQLQVHRHLPDRRRPDSGTEQVAEAEAQVDLVCRQGSVQLLPTAAAQSTRLSFSFSYPPLGCNNFAADAGLRTI